MEELKQSMQQLPDFSDLLLIDGDAIPYMIGWHHRDHRHTSTVWNAVDRWMSDFLILTGARHYLGFMAHPQSHTCFRYGVYKYKPYKGNRPEKEEWILYWEPLIRERLETKWGFIHAQQGLETDDMVACLADERTVICSPDKDLRQIPGRHIDYRKTTETGQLLSLTIDRQEATYNWCMQMLTGDTTDNVAGVPGMGPAKAEKLLKETTPILWRNAVKLAYQKYFGEYYGPIIYDETAAVITMMTPEHPLWEQHSFDKLSYLSMFKHAEQYV